MVAWVYVLLPLLDRDLSKVTDSVLHVLPTHTAWSLDTHRRQLVINICSLNK